MKRFLLVLVALAMVVTCFVGCSNKDEAQESDTVSTVVQEESAPYDPVLDTLDFEGMEISVLFSDVTDMPRSEIVGASGEDAVENATWARNIYIQEKFNVKFVFIGVEGLNIQDEVRKCFLAQDPEMDIYIPYEVYGMQLAAEGVYENIYNLEYVNPDSQWWNGSWNKASTYKNQLYGLVGDMNTSLYLKTFVTFVNNGILKDRFPTDTPDLYAVVNEGKWTLEYVKTLIKDIYEDNGLTAGIRDEMDTYGLAIGNISQPSQALVQGCDFGWTISDTDGRYLFDLETERNINVIQAIQSFFTGTDEGIYLCQNLAGAYKYADMFCNNNLMIAMAPMFTAEQLVETTIDYLVLPMPKYDETQDRYISMSQDSHTFCAVSAVSDAKDAAGAVLEYMGYLSDKDLTPLYFETLYKYEYASDMATMDMFDNIVGNIEFQFAVNWTRSLGNVMTKVRQLACNPLKGAASELSSLQSMCQGNLNDTMDALDKLVSGE